MGYLDGGGIRDQASRLTSSPKPSSGLLKVGNCLRPCKLSKQPCRSPVRPQAMSQREPVRSARSLPMPPIWLVALQGRYDEQVRNCLDMQREMLCAVPPQTQTVSMRCNSSAEHCMKLAKYRRRHRVDIMMSTKHTSRDLSHAMAAEGSSSGAAPPCMMEGSYLPMASLRAKPSSSAARIWSDPSRPEGKSLSVENRHALLCGVRSFHFLFETNSTQRTEGQD